MRFTPHEYQQYAINFLAGNTVAAMFLDMGLGKTVITLTVLRYLLFTGTIRRVIVVAPLRVAQNVWPAEIDKWDHLQALRYSVVVGTEIERKAALRAPADIYIINRENVQWLIEKSGLPFDFDTVIIDELSSFKSHQAKRFKSLLKVRPNIKRIVGLTGTPATNGLMDLWAEFRVLDMGQRLGKYIGWYRENFFLPDKRNAQVIFTYKPLPGAEEKIYAKIADITISMKSAEHIRMPGLVSVDYPVRLTQLERAHYDEMRRELVLQLPDGEVRVPMPPCCPASSYRWPTARFMMIMARSTAYMTANWTHWRI